MRWLKSVTAALLIAAVLAVGCPAPYRKQVPARFRGPAGYSALADLSMRAERAVYAPEDPAVTVCWVNHSEKTLLFGQAWSLYRQDQRGWEPVESPGVFFPINYRLCSGQVREHVYNMVDTLSPGRYAIQTACHDEDTGVNYPLTCVFEVAQPSP